MRNVLPTGPDEGKGSKDKDVKGGWLDATTITKAQRKWRGSVASLKTSLEAVKVDYDDVISKVRSSPGLPDACETWVVALFSFFLTLLPVVYIFLASRF